MAVADLGIPWLATVVVPALAGVALGVPEALLALAVTGLAVLVALVAGAGFPGATLVSVALTFAAGLAAGCFRVVGTGAALAFALTAVLPTGFLALLSLFLAGTALDFTLVWDLVAAFVGGVLAGDLPTAFTAAFGFALTWAFALVLAGVLVVLADLGLLPDLTAPVFGLPPDRDTVFAGAVFVAAFLTGVFFGAGLGALLATAGFFFAAVLTAAFFATVFTTFPATDAATDFLPAGFLAAAALGADFVAVFLVAISFPCCRCLMKTQRAWPS